MISGVLHLLHLLHLKSRGMKKMRNRMGVTAGVTGGVTSGVATLYPAQIDEYQAKPSVQLVSLRAIERAKARIHVNTNRLPLLSDAAELTTTGAPGQLW
jgi:hypothetical protein